MAPEGRESAAAERAWKVWAEVEEGVPDVTVKKVDWAPMLERMELMSVALDEAVTALRPPVEVAVEEARVLVIEALPFEAFELAATAPDALDAPDEVALACDTEMLLEAPGRADVADSDELDVV